MPGSDYDLNLKRVHALSFQLLRHSSSFKFHVQLALQNNHFSGTKRICSRRIPASLPAHEHTSKNEDEKEKRLKPKRIRDGAYHHGRDGLNGVVHPPPCKKAIAYKTGFRRTSWPGSSGC